MILWTGLMSRSEICNLCRSCCLKSYNVKVGRSLMSWEGCFVCFLKAVNEMIYLKVGVDVL